MELSARMARLYQEDVGRPRLRLAPDVAAQGLGAHPGDHRPRRAAHRAAARPMSSSGPETRGVRDVYYAVRSFPSYGKLSKRNLDELRVGARVEAVRGQARSPRLRALEGRRPRRGLGLGQPVGQGPPRVAHRVLGHGGPLPRGTASTCTAAGWTSSFPTTRTRSPRARPPTRTTGPLRLDLDPQRLRQRRQGEDGEVARQLRHASATCCARNDAEALRYFLLTVHYRGPIAFDTHKLDDGRVIFPGRRRGASGAVDYLYQAADRASTLDRRRPAPARTPPGEDAEGCRRGPVHQRSPPRTARRPASTPRSTTISTPRGARGPRRGGQGGQRAGRSGAEAAEGRRTSPAPPAPFVAPHILIAACGLAADAARPPADAVAEAYQRADPEAAARGSWARPGRRSTRSLAERTAGPRREGLRAGRRPPEGARCATASRSPTAPKGRPCGSGP